MSAIKGNMFELLPGILLEFGNVIGQQGDLTGAIRCFWENVGQVRAVALSRDGWLVKTGRLRARARSYLTQLGIKASSVDQHVGQLSGGNQQKVVFAKWLEASPSVMLLNDPTRGIDVGAKAEIYALIRDLTRQGVVQVFASTDPLELAAVCDRVIVVYNNRICATLQPPVLSAHTILEVMNTGRMPEASDHAPGQTTWPQTR